MLDAKKVLPILSLENFNQNKLSEQDLNLMIELKTMTEGLLQRSIFHGYWDCITDDKGSIPDSREGSAMAMVDNTIYLFGGFSREIYNDTRYYEIDNNVWGTVQPGPDSKIPEKRQNHTMVSYKDQLLLFGGSGPYMPSVKMRASFNDLWVFKTKDHRWQKVDCDSGVPKKRIGHVACMFGCIMLVHGGYSAEGKIMLDDFNLYDAKIGKWLDVAVYLKG